MYPLSCLEEIGVPRSGEQSYAASDWPIALTLADVQICFAAPCPFSRARSRLQGQRWQPRLWGIRMCTRMFDRLGSSIAVTQFQKRQGSFGGFFGGSTLGCALRVVLTLFHMGRCGCNGAGALDRGGEILCGFISMNGTANVKGRRAWYLVLRGRRELGELAEESAGTMSRAACRRVCTWMADCRQDKARRETWQKYSAFLKRKACVSSHKKWKAGSASYGESKKGKVEGGHMFT